MKYYLVTCHKGHLGAGRSTEIHFAVIAENILHACNIAKKMPSVKHSRGVCYAREITEQEYLEHKQRSAYKRWM